MLASNDPGTVAEYVGQRIVLTSGVGTGQYGYIQAYDDSTKIATVVRIFLLSSSINSPFSAIYV